MPGVDPETVRVDVPDPPEMVIGEREAATPAGYDRDNETVPVNPLSEPTVMVDVPDVPELNETTEGEAVTVKS